jgi:hypothetical protein
VADLVVEESRNPHVAIVVDGEILRRHGVERNVSQEVARRGLEGGSAPQQRDEAGDNETPAIFVHARISWVGACNLLLVRAETSRESILLAGWSGRNLTAAFQPGRTSLSPRKERRMAANAR